MTDTRITFVSDLLTVTVENLDDSFPGFTDWELDGLLAYLRGPKLRQVARDLGIRVKSSSKVGDIRHDMRNILAARAGQSGVDVLADLLSLDGGKTPAKIVEVPVHRAIAENTGMEYVAPVIDAVYRTESGEIVTVVSVGGPTFTLSNHVVCNASSLSGWIRDGVLTPVECEACHDAPADRSLTLSGTIAGSSGPVTDGTALKLCAPCYRHALSWVNERGHGCVTILWHTRKINGEVIRFNDPAYTTRYVYVETTRHDDAWDAARAKSRILEPGYAPVITSCMYANPNHQRAYLVTRDNVDAVEYHTPGNAWGLAWEVRERGGDATFACAEINPVTAEIVEWLWVRRPNVGDVIVYERGPYYTSTVVSVDRESMEVLSDNLSDNRPAPATLAIRDYEQDVKAFRISLIRKW